VRAGYGEELMNRLAERLVRVITEITGELVTVFTGRFSEGDGAPGGAMTLSETGMSQEA